MGSIVTLTNTILGAGMLAMPSAIAAIGLIPGVFMILFSGLCSGFGLWLLAESARRAGPRGASFFAISRITFPSAAAFFDAAIAIKCFGVSVSYLVIAGDLLPQVADAALGNSLPSDSIFRSKPFWILCSTPLVIPTVMMRKLESLRHTSTAALGAVVYLLFLVVLMFVQLNDGVPSKDIDLVLTREMSIFKAIKALPVFIFAFTCHQNIFAVYNELKDNGSSFINRVIQTAIALSVTTYLILGVVGYLTFGRTVVSNIIAAYPSERTLVVVGQACIAALVLFSFPLQAHPARTSIDKVLTVLFPPESAISGPGGAAVTASAADPLPQRMSQTRHVSISASFLIAAYSTAILSAGNLGGVLSIVGATGSVTIQYILPGLFYYYCTQGEDDEEDDEQDESDTDDEEGRLLEGAAAKPPRSPRIAAAYTPARRTIRQLALSLAIYGFLVMFIALGVRIV